MKYNKNEVTGKMRDRIILQNVNRSRSLTGFASESWADVATIWAFAESKLPGSNETIIEGKNTAKNICDFTIRYISSITEESRVVWGDKLYQVKNLKVSHDRRFISFQGVFYDSYILTGVNVAASVNGIGTTSANLKLIMSVIGQANAIASAIGELTVFQQGVVEVAASVNALGTVSANVTKVININSSVDANANVSAPLTIAKNIQSSVEANAISTGEINLIKNIASSVSATATATSILDVVTQGIVLLDASVTATGEITANLSRIATLASSPTTAAETSAVATLTKVLEATATATAETNASAQLTIPVNASATATAETSANAQLTYTVNASATATAETSAEAQIVRIISASATAMAESSAEASFGITFAANVQGTANVTNATIARAATMVGSVTGQANVTGATLTTVDNVAASVNAAATVTNATLNVAVVDPNFANVSLLLHGNGADGSTLFTDNSPNAFTVSGNGNAQIDTAIKQFGTGSIQFDGSGDFLTVPDNEAFTLGASNFTIEMWVYPNVITTRQYLLYQGSSAGANASISFGIEIHTTSKINAFVCSGINIFFVTSTANITQSAWSHIAFVRDGTSINLYINGTRVATTTIGTSSVNNATNLVYIGSGNTFLPYNGYIDDLRITKGVARYTGATLPVPASQFPDQ